MLEIILFIIGLRLIKFSWDIQRIRPISCPDLPIERLDGVIQIIDRQIEVLERVELEIAEYV
jgi:hypothetical protein